MKRIILLFSAIILTSSVFCQTPTETLSDKDLATYIWALSKTYPDGFTFDLNTFSHPKEGLYVSYKETQNSFTRKSIRKVIKHAHAHDNIVGGWRDPDTGLFYFDSNRRFPEDSLAAAVQFARDNGQHTVYDAKKDINVLSNYEQQDIRIIYDCDMGSSTDDLFRPHDALPLYGYEALHPPRCNR